MKKLLYLFLALLILACSSDDSNNTNNNVSDGQYFFEIEICGLTHSIQGNNEDMFFNGQNSCSAFLSNGIQALGFNLTDITAPDYVSGQPMNIAFGILNPQLGADNTGVLSFQSSIYSDFLNNCGDQNNITFYYDQFVENTPMDINNYDPQRINNISNINLTDLGTPPTTAGAYGSGTNIKGTYEGTLYFLDDNTNGTPDANWNIPIPIKISFSAVRAN
tara:strand:- start:49 stop:705 length:657 start_codon:yes stop_codon:yes gene_type:complete